MFDFVWLGIRGWVWIYFFLSIGMGISVIIYWYRETIKKKYFEIRFPEQLIRIVMHFKAGLFTEYWRLIPKDKYFTIDESNYAYDDKSVIKTDFIASKKNEKITFNIKGKEYNFDSTKLIKQKRREYPEIHYYNNCPNPLNFDMSNKEVKFTSKQLFDFESNDLFTKLLTMDTERNMLVMLFTIAGINLIATVFILAHMMGWI